MSAIALSGHPTLTYLKSLSEVKRTCLMRRRCPLVTQNGHLASSTALPLVDALSGWSVNRENNHVVLAKIAQRVLLTGAYLADSARRDRLRISVNRYVSGPAEEVEQMAPRFDVWHRMIARFQTNQFCIESAAIIAIRQCLVLKASCSG